MLVHIISHLTPGLTSFVCATLEFVRFNVTNLSEKKCLFFCYFERLSWEYLLKTTVRFTVVDSRRHSEKPRKHTTELKRRGPMVRKNERTLGGSEAIHDKIAALDNFFGFVDGTVRPIARPVVNQRAVYNGHKRINSVKFQSAALKNGLIGHLFGPVSEIYFKKCIIHRSILP